MGKVKELFMEEHDALIEKYLEDHPGATTEQACDATADRAYDRTVDRYADMCDQARQRAKDEQR